jgi:hypothetical protein
MIRLAAVTAAGLTAATIPYGFGPLEITIFDRQFA